MVEHEHFVTQNVPLLVEAMPDFFIEIPEGLAAEKGIENGGRARVWSKRGEVEGVAIVTKRIKPLLGIPDELSIIDVMCFGPPEKASYKRWKKDLPQIMNWERFNMDNFMSDEDIELWIKNTRHKVMFKAESKID